MPSILLSPFQREKLEYYFRFLEPDADGNLTVNSIDRIMERILDFTGWGQDSVIAKNCREVHMAFFEVLFEKSQDEGEKDKVSLQIWLSLWSSLLHGVMGIHNFPVWLRLMPRVLFQICDRRDQERLTANDLELFYKQMVNLSPEEAKEISVRAYAQMTDNGKYPLTLSSYEQLFANFLIGRTPNGPGRYIFGCFEHTVQPFQLIQPMPDPEDDEMMEVAKAYMGRRPSRNRI